MISTSGDSKLRPFNINKNQISEKIRRLINLLEQPLTDRSNYQSHQISLYLVEYPFFSRFASSGILVELIKHLKIELFQIGSVIIPWNASESNFYLILTGRIGQYRKDDSGFDQGRELLSGSYFGENGISGDISNDEYRSLETSQLMVLEKNIFEVVISSIQKERYEEQYNFFKTIPVIECLSEETIAYLAKIALPKKFAPNTLIAKQNERLRGFYIVHSGSVKLLRNVSVEQSGRSMVRIVEIDEIESGGIVCDYAFIYQEPVEYSVLCAMPLVAFFIDKDYFRGNNQKYLNELKNIAEKIPSDIELSEKFLQKVSWKKFKDDFMGSLHIRNRKNNTIRLPRINNVRLPSLKRGRNLSV